MSGNINKLVFLLIIICILSGCKSNNSITTNYDIIESFQKEYDAKGLFNYFNIIDLSINENNYKVAVMQGKDSVQAIYIYKQNEESLQELYMDYRGYNQSYIVYLINENKTIVVISNPPDCKNITDDWSNQQEKHKLNINERYSVMIFDKINKIKSIKNDYSDECIQDFLEIEI